MTAELALMVKWLQEDPDAFGILPFLLYQENDDVIAANAINGVSPNSENITNGRYALARPIYLYVKTKHVDDQGRNSARDTALNLTPIAR